MCALDKAAPGRGLVCLAVRNLTAISLPPASFSGLLLFFGPSFVSSDETRKTVQHTSIPVPVLQLALQRVDLGLQFADVFHELAVLHRRALYCIMQRIGCLPPPSSMCL